jgi:predicted ATPase/DNA-binding CsgD family transcriptional regulator
MIDRELELARIVDALSAALVGTPRAVLVGGEAGVGKSRLVAEAIGRGRSDGWLVMRGSCLALGRDIPYLPFVEMLRTLTRELPAADAARILGPAGQDLARLLPELPRVRPDPQPARNETTAHDPTALGAVRAGHDATALEAERSRHDATALEAERAGIARLRLFDGLLRVAERLAADRPLVAVVEDLQWADEASLALLAYLQHGLRSGPVVLVLTFRTDEVTGPGLDLLADLERDERVDRIELAGLDAEHTGRQMAAILGRRLSKTAVLRSHRLSGGNPFFTEELIASDRGLTSLETSAGPGHWQAMTPRLRDLMRARADELTPDALAIARVASTASRAVDASVLSEVAGVPIERTEAALRAAIEAHILVAVSEPQAAGFRFRHELMRAFVASEILPSESARYHARMADLLETTASVSRHPGELAYHRDAAGDAPRALEAHLGAALASEVAFAWEAAHHHYGRALELWEGVRAPDRPADGTFGADRILVEGRAADAAARSGDLDRAVELARSVLATTDVEHAELRAAMRSSLRWFLWLAGRTVEAVAEAERAIDAVTSAAGLPGAERWRSNALAHLSGLLLLTGDVRRARQRAEEAFRAAESAGAREEMALATGVLSWCHIHAGNLDDGLDLIASVLAAAIREQPPHIMGVALAYGQLARALELAGQVDKAVDVAGDGIAWCVEHGLGSTFGQALAADRSRGLYHLGRWDQAESAATAALDGGPPGPGTLALVSTLALLGAARGDGDVVAESLARAQGVGRLEAAQEPLGWLRAAAAEHALTRSDAAGALDVLGYLDRVGIPGRRADDLDGGAALPSAALPSAARPSAALPSADASRARRLALAARAVAERAELERAGAVPRDERIERAAASIRADLRRAERHPAILAGWRADLLCAAAELERAGRPGTRQEAARWRRAASASAELRRPYAEAYARFRLASSLVAARGDRDEATGEARRCLDLATGLGAHALLAEAEQLVRRARLPIASGPFTGAATAEAAATAASASSIPFDLTERELDVVALVAAGDTNREIGEKLFISPKTASVHVSNILGKMGVRSRVEAATLALRLGLVGDPDARVLLHVLPELEAPGRVASHEQE